MPTIDAVREKIIARQEWKPIGWLARLARKAGWAPGTVTMFRNGTYIGNNELLASTLAAAMDQEDREELERG